MTGLCDVLTTWPLNCASSRSWHVVLCGCNSNPVWDSVTNCSLVNSHFVIKLVILPLTLKMVTVCAFQLLYTLPVLPVQNVNSVKWVYSLYHWYHILLLGMWRSLNSNSTMFELRTFSPDSKFDECFKCFVVECELVEKSLFYDWFHMHRQPDLAQTTQFFSQIQPITQTTVTYEWATLFLLSDVLHCTNMKWTLILLTLGNNIL